jgi:bacillithiol synthase
MLRAQKRNYAAQQRHIHALKATLFPQDNLQERIENLLPFYARYGRNFIQELYAASPALEQVFAILKKN